MGFWQSTFAMAVKGKAERIMHCFYRRCLHTYGTKPSFVTPRLSICNVRVSHSLFKQDRMNCRCFSIDMKNLVMDPEPEDLMSEKLAPQKSHNLQSKLRNASSVNDIIKIAGHSKDISLPNSVFILKKIKQLQDSDESKSKMPNEEKLDTILEPLNANATTLHYTTLLQCLSTLLDLCKNDLSVIKSLETQVLWLLKTMPLEHVCHVISLHHRHQETELRKKVYTDAIAMVDNRFEGIKHPKELISLLYGIPKMSHSFQEKLEGKCLQLSEEMTSKEIYRILYLMGKHGKRNAPLLQALTLNLSKKGIDLSLVQLCNLVYACSVLSLPYTELLNSISEKLILILNKEEFNQTLQGSLLTSLSHSLSVLSWRHPPLLEKLTEFSLGDHTIQEIDPKYALDNPKLAFSLLHTCAHLCYVPAVVDKRWSSLFEAAASLDPKRRIETVWCSCVLDREDPAMLNSVLTSDFLTHAEDLRLFDQVPTLLKILNIDTAAGLNCSYSGNHLPDGFTAKHKLPGSKPRECASPVVEALSSMASVEKYMLLNSQPMPGYVVDIEMLVNEKLEPQPVANFKQHDGKISGSGNTSLPPVPSSFHRLAIKVHDYHDVTLHTTSFTGVNKLISKHLQQSGYKVIEINLSEFMKQKDVVRKVKFIRDQIKSAIEKSAS